MVRKKWKRKSGYTIPSLTISKRDLLENNLSLNPSYDDWSDWRDGFRDWFSDFKTIKKINFHKAKHLDDKLVQKRITMNQKQKRLLNRRKVMKID